MALKDLIANWATQSQVDQGTLLLMIIVCGCALAIAFAGIIDSIRRKPRVEYVQQTVARAAPTRKSKTLAKSFRDYGTRVRHTKIRIK